MDKKLGEIGDNVTDLKSKMDTALPLLNTITNSQTATQTELKQFIEEQRRVNQQLTAAMTILLQERDIRESVKANGEEKGTADEEEEEEEEEEEAIGADEKSTSPLAEAAAQESLSPNDKHVGIINGGRTRFCDYP